MQSSADFTMRSWNISPSSDGDPATAKLFDEATQGDASSSVTLPPLLRDLLRDIAATRDDQNVPLVVADLASVAAILLNVGTLLAVYHTPGRLSVNLRLILSLTLSDVLVAVCVFVSNRSRGLKPLVFAVDTCLLVVLRSLQNAINIIALSSLLGLAVDHYFAICRPLEYPTRMRPRIITAVIVMFWIVATLVGFSDMFLPLGNCTSLLDHTTYCDAVWCSKYESDYAVFPLAMFVFSSMIVVYGLIYNQVNRTYKTRRFVTRTDLLCNARFIYNFYSPEL